MNKLRIAALVAAIATMGVFVAGCTPSETETAPATTGTTTGGAMSDSKMAPAEGGKMATPPGPGTTK